MPAPSTTPWWLAFISILVCIASVYLYTFDVWLVKDWLKLYRNPHSSLDSAEQWNRFYHLGGYSPWIRKTRGVLENGTHVPEGCVIDQVHMMSRHAERYPTIAPGVRMLQLYHRLKNANITFEGGLAFANDWDFFAPFPNEQFEQLTTTGPYAGTLEAFATGVKLRTRYPKLLEHALEKEQTSFWASDSARVIDTARLFASAFFGLDWGKTAKLHIIPETNDRGGNTLTPGRACPEYAKDPRGHGYGLENQAIFRESYLTSISERLRIQNPGINFTDSEVYSMQEMCGFETLVKGSSDWCKAFTSDEWLSFEYARDLLYYYRAGPGNRYGPSLGWLWLNATANLLLEGPEAGPFFFSFNHDGDINAMLGSLDLFPQRPRLPTNHILHNRTWRMSDVTPMGGRIIFERYSCPAPQECWDRAEFGYPNHVYCDIPRNDTFVRVNVNDGIVPIPGCSDGIGGGCQLGNFLEKVKKRGEELPPFDEICGLSEDAPKGITFLHQ